MRPVRWLLSVLVMVVAVVVGLAALAGGVGVWVVKAPLTARTTQLLDRADKALEVAGVALREADTSLDRALASVQSVKEGHARLTGNTAQDRPALSLIALSLQDGLLPQVHDARQRLLVAAEAAVAIQSVLGGIGDFPLLSISPLDQERLQQVSTDLGRVGASAQELRAMLTSAAGGDGVAPAAVGSRAGDIQQVLQEVRVLAAEYARKVAQVRTEVGTLRSRVLAWIGPATVVVSALLFWIALSQVSVLAHAWSWLRKGPA